jgi:hypothetical protein
MIYNADMTVRELTDKEMIRIAGDRRMLAIQWARMKAAEEESKK